MKMLMAALLFVGISAFASTGGYDLKMDLSLNGKLVSSPRMIVKAGEKAMITQSNNSEESFIEVTAKEGPIQNHKGILMNFVVGTVGKDGKRTVLSEPQILAKENEPAQITVDEANGSKMSLSVVAKRKSL